MDLIFGRQHFFFSNLQIRTRSELDTLDKSQYCKLSLNEKGWLVIEHPKPNGTAFYGNYLLPDSLIPERFRRDKKHWL